MWTGDEKYVVCPVTQAVANLVAAYAAPPRLAHFHAAAHDACLPYPPAG